MLNPKQKKSHESGQALVEFLMLVPIVMAFVWYLVHVSSAINKSIVGQKHARSQLFLKMFNHRSGPMQRDADGTNRAVFYIGVAGNVMQAVASPIAPVEKMGIGPNPKKIATADDDPGEAKPNSFRQNVRVRTVFGICTQRKPNPSGQGVTDFCGSDSGDPGAAPVPVSPGPAPSGI